MRSAIIMLLLTSAASAVQAAEDKRQLAKPPPMAAKPPSRNPCAAYGPGFVQVEGGSTCVRIGGALEAGVGGSSRR